METVNSSHFPPEWDLRKGAAWTICKFGKFNQVRAWQIKILKLRLI